MTRWSQSLGVQRFLAVDARINDQAATNNVVLWDGTLAGIWTILRWLIVGSSCPEAMVPDLFRRQAKWSVIESLLAVDVIVIVVAAGQAEHDHYYHIMGYFLLLLVVSMCRTWCCFLILFARSTRDASISSAGAVRSGPLHAWAHWYVTSAFFRISKFLVVINSAGLAHVAFFLIIALQSRHEHQANVALLSLFVPLIVSCWSLVKNLLFCVDGWRSRVTQRAFASELAAQAAAAAQRAGEAKLLLKSLIECPYGDLDEKFTGCITTCLICLEEFAAPDTVVILPCNHTFHRSCAQSWLHRETRCPLRCRVLSRSPSSP
jgi:hypothetical protein